MDNNCDRTAGFRDTISDNYIENICQRNETIQFLLVEALAALPRVITSEMTRTIFFLLYCIQVLNQYELLSYRVNNLIRIRK